LSPDNTGEFASSLFYVILISLALSWLTAVSTTPLLCALLLKVGNGGGEDQDPYAGKAFQIYRGLVAAAVNNRWVTVAGVIGLFVLAVIGFGHVKRRLFPGLQHAPVFCRYLRTGGFGYSHHPR
jgi:multidrug efflux pump subunit AcrB